MWRDIVLRSMLAVGAAIALTTELLGAFGLLRPVPLWVAWAVLLCVGFALLRGRVRELTRPARPGMFDGSLVGAMGAIAGILLFIALLSPPNSSDAMAYHMPRVVYWAQAGSVAFFPTPYFNQITLQPLAEYIMLHTYILSGGDHFANLGQWVGFVGGVLAASLVARELGAGKRGQVLAAVFCATLPNGILQATGAKNDYLLACWLMAMLYFALRRQASWTAAALSLALFTKATAYLFAPPLLIAAGWGWLLRPRVTVTLAAGVLLVNGPLYWRNFELSGSPLGYDSAQGDGFFCWRNERLTMPVALSNVLRHAGEQLGARSERWNQGVYQAVLGAHSWIGADPNDPATTWPWARYEAPRNANHESNANNRWHLLLLALAFPGCAFGAGRKWLGYAAGVCAGFLLFCAYLKWQPFMARMLLPLFVAASPLAGCWGERLKPAWFQAALCLLLLNHTRPYLFENWVRPLEGPNSLLRTDRKLNYFSDMTSWNNKESYLRAVELIAESGCTRVGIDISRLTLEYPLQALLRERIPGVRFEHTRDGNAWPCAIVCLDCAGIQEKEAQYSSDGRRVQAGRFLLRLSE